MRRIPILLTLLLWSGLTLAAGKHYSLRVDGLACPYCAYGIEKKLKAIDGVQRVHVDLDRGLVEVDTRDDVTLTEPQLRQLFRDAGFTYRSMQVRPQ